MAKPRSHLCLALIYIAAMLALGLHAYHGVWSVAQTLGVTSVRSDRAWRIVSAASELALSIGNIATRSRC